MSIAAQIAKSHKCFVRLIPTLQSRLIQSRFATTGRENCKKKADALRKDFVDPCGVRRSQIVIKKKKKKPKFISMWENPACCLDPCPEPFPRYDLMWEESDKAKRIYTRTWNECPHMKKVTKKVCCMSNRKWPPLKKRPRKERPKTAEKCEPDPTCKPAPRKGPCTKLSLANCKAARDPPSCLFQRGPDDCQKICTPYPSFSECQKDKPKPKRPVECNCLRIVAMCEVMMRARKMRAMKKK